MSGDLVFTHLPVDLEATPASWTTAPLGDVATDIQTGFASGKHNRDGTGLPHLRPMNISPDGEIDLSDARYVTPDRGEQRLVRGDVLFNNTNSPVWVGKTALIESDDELAFSNHMTRLRFASGVRAPFVAHQLHFYCRAGYFQHQCKKHVNQASISRTFLGKNTPFLLPPENEQRRIVAKIESLQARSEAAKEALDAIPPLLEKFRQSVLAAAFRGDLTASWRAKNPDVEPASLLLERIRAERRTRWIADAAEKGRARAEARARKAGKPWTAADDAKVLDKERVKAAKKYKAPEPVDAEQEGLPELPEGWCWARLDELSAIKGGLTKGKKRKPEDELLEVPYLRVANVQRGYLNLTEVKTIVATTQEVDDLRLIKGDVLFNEGGDRDKLGRGWIWNNEVDDCIHQNHVFRARLIHPDIRPRFVSHYGNSQAARLYFLRSGKQTTNLASINMTKLKALPIPLAPAAEQMTLARIVEQMLAGEQDVSASIAIELDRLASFNQSILAKAFRGELVPQDPTDEPASVLLERIRAEREAAEAAKKAAKKKRGRKRR